jgi:hypothetical protein
MATCASQPPLSQVVFVFFANRLETELIMERQLGICVVGFMVAVVVVVPIAAFRVLLHLFAKWLLSDRNRGHNSVSWSRPASG